MIFFLHVALLYCLFEQKRLTYLNTNKKEIREEQLIVQPYFNLQITKQ